MRSSLTVIVQAMAALLILLTLFAMKSFAYEYFVIIKDWYNENINDSIVITANAPVVNYYES